MKAGRFTEKMTVQRVETTIDQFGGETQTWTDRYLDVWCQPMAIGSSAAGGGEYNDDHQMQADAKYEFVCRYLPGVEYTDRIYWSGGYFDIYQIFPIGRREGMRIRGSWSDDQADAWSMGGLNAEQVVSGTGGLTLSEVTAEYENNTTGQTFPELVTFYTDETSGATPQIAYPRILHMDQPNDTTTEWGANSYTARLAAGDYDPGVSPTKILHVAELDYADPNLGTLLNNNELGNKHRFTYDDGTEATEANFSSFSGGSFAAGIDGYTGSNPQYIIDHLTGLGWYRGPFSVTSSAAGEWYDSRGLYDFFTDYQDFIDAPADVTLSGYSDWRRPTFNEMNFSLANANASNWMSGTTTDVDTYFPPLNNYVRGYGGNLLYAGPIDSNSSSGTPTWVAIRGQSNSVWLTETTQATMESLIASGTNSNYGTILCRRHYDNR